MSYSIYEKCPVYESEKFIFRMVEEKDAEDLLECYSDLNAFKFFNSDNCTSDFFYKTLEEMKECIKFWIDQYKDKYYVRFSIVDKQRYKAIGTIEFYDRKVSYKDISKVGVLRLDLASKYEKEELITDILDIVINNLCEAFEVENIITKAIPDARERILALNNKGFERLEDKAILPYNDYYIR
ncbi:GNAT family N-acetyltransferase [Clostridium sp. 'White wine YQ']|uniref:GNAT family N-acetyltransferase n=1 Tax=Clostridium sp. 'White wine YQ' TaxID=3027474 RepID=UPI002365E8CF|nr:GNAT family protein [Clostridium sp. 'White wine YQ']MDD7794442.1 GNAT family protein [Clostridium sp. 'White wine YQ']